MSSAENSGAEDVFLKMLTPLRISTLCIALTAVLSMTLLVADSASTSGEVDNQTISASAGSAEAEVGDNVFSGAVDKRLVVDGLAAENNTAEDPDDDITTDDDELTMQDPLTGSADPLDPSSSNDPSTAVTSPDSKQSTPQDSPSAATTTQVPSATPEATTNPAPNPTTKPAPAKSSSASKFEPMRNTSERFNRFASTPSKQLNVSALMEPVSPVDHGGNTAGQFRIACEYSHFNYDDPIVFPGQSGKSHFHMYFGNTETDANTTKDSLVNRGGGTCNGFELNRSSYWTPALLDGKGNAIVPDQIIIYYKTKFPNKVQPMPQGLQIIGGNANGEDFSPSETLFWSCGSTGQSYNHTNRIPSCGGDAINATIAFPQCWDGKNLTSPDFSSHMKQISESSACPASHPVRLPQLTYLLYFPPGNSSSWYLSSDRTDSFNTGPGATLHGDWMGAWHEETMNLWINTCVKRARNCSYGQTGTPQKLAALNPLQTFAGNNTVPIPK